MAMWGRTIHAQDDEASFVVSFDVGIEDEHLAISAVRILRPELTGYRLDGRNRLSPTATAYLELLPGEVRQQAGARPQSSP